MESGCRNIFVHFECCASPLCPFDLLPLPIIEENECGANHPTADYPYPMARAACRKHPLLTLFSKGGSRVLRRCSPLSCTKPHPQCSLLVLCDPFALVMPPTKDEQQCASNDDYQMEALEYGGGAFRGIAATMRASLPALRGGVRAVGSARPLAFASEVGVAAQSMIPRAAYVGAWGLSGAAVAADIATKVPDA